ncbi:MAG: aromatic acid exporter family protein [Lachnospiraceae bacterium]|nr:aromatic acid exporter family protein [Lachnospiraceae bacterium]MDD3615511.1 aromatic acid exporter family protein [Lachnospiraceae bacterium]
MDKYRKIIILSLKIGMGSCLALYIAQLLGLEYPVSAGTITLLTLLTSKWETVRLSVCRLATFTMTVLIAGQLFLHVQSAWIAYGLLLMIIVFIAEVFEWRTTISVNGVIAAHLVTNHDFSDAAIWNEFLLVLIGIVVAIIFNLFQGNSSHKKYIVANMKSVEERLQLIIGALAAYLSNKEMERSVWEDICTLEKDIQNCIKEAYEYQNNTFHSHPEYYISYFEMRHSQCQVLHNLHYEMKKIRTMPKQAKIVAEYMLYLTDYVTEFNRPEEQREKLEDMIKLMETSALPQTREEFRNRALVYHILMDLEDFLKYKMRFIKGLDETKLKIYWKNC